VAVRIDVSQIQSTRPANAAMDWSLWYAPAVKSFVKRTGGRATFWTPVPGFELESYTIDARNPPRIESRSTAYLIHRTSSRPGSSTASPKSVEAGEVSAEFLTELRQRSLRPTSDRQRKGTLWQFMNSPSGSAS